MTGVKNKCLGLFDLDTTGKNQTMAIFQWCRRRSLHGYDDDRGIHVNTKIDRLVKYFIRTLIAVSE